MEKKYILTDEKIKFQGKTLYRIQAVKTFQYGGKKIRKGSLGGFVESYDNLSQDGNCWIFDDAKVLGQAFVRSHAAVCDNACIYDHAEICGWGTVGDFAVVYDKDALSGREE